MTVIHEPKWRVTAQLDHHSARLVAHDDGRWEVNPTWDIPISGKSERGNLLGAQEEGLAAFEKFMARGVAW